MGGRDRTAEFIATVNSKRDKPQYIQQRQQQRQQLPQKPVIDPQYRELMRLSQECSHKISDAFGKLEKFTHLAKKRTVFDDGELNRLISEIRADINDTKQQFDHLQSKCQPKQRHTEKIVTILKHKLANVTNDFKTTLETRSRSVQKQTARHEMYAGATETSKSSAYHQQANGGPSMLDMMAAGPSKLYPANDIHSSLHSNEMHQQQQQQSILMNDHMDLAERADKMQFIESTIVELGTVFNQLANIVHDQGEQITRIDMNISDTTAHVGAAHDELLRYFASINSNRWLILKVFGVLFFFFVIFVMFSA